MSDNRRGNDRVAYFNGRIVPEREVVLPFRDRGFKYGDAAFDMTRTFHGRPFKLKEHVDRLYRSLRYLRIDLGLSPAEMVAASEEVLERNRHFLTPETDYWLGQRVSRGVDAVGDEGWEHTGPNVIVECIPLPLRKRAPLFRDGIDIVVPPTRRVPPDSLSPRAKTHNYLNLIMADLEAKAQVNRARSHPDHSRSPVMGALPVHTASMSSGSRRCNHAARRCVARGSVTEMAQPRCTQLVEVHPDTGPDCTRGAR